MSELDKISRNRWAEYDDNHQCIIKVVCPVFSDAAGRLYSYHSGVLLDDPTTGYTHPFVSEEHPHPHLVFKYVAVPDGYLETKLAELNQKGGE